MSTQSENKDATNKALSADEQIQARSQAHQHRLKKFAMIGLGVVAIVVGIYIVAQVTSQEASAEKVVQAQQNTTLTAQQVEVYRNQFKQALTQYEINIQPEIDKILLSQWETSRANDLNFMKETALSAFAKGAYLQAKQEYEELLVASETLIDDWQQQTQTYINTARAHFEQEQIPQAQIELNKAFELMPTNSQAIELQTRISAHAEVATLLKELTVAKIENNLPKQIDLLSDIVQLDPARNDLSEDLQTAKTTYDTKLLKEALDNAEKALNNNQLEQAQRFINSAKLIKADSKGAQRLQASLNNKQSNLALAEIKTKLQALASQDSWEQVDSMAKANLSKFPNDAELFDYSQQASQILSAKRSLNSFISRPERLADENIRQAASNAISKAFGPSLSSPSLQSQIEQLAAQIEQYEVEVPVTISSDNETYIIVVGVGHVGKHKEKIVSLKPGKYILEGSRDGYRSKRSEITVKANQPLSVSLVCNERIAD